MNQGFDRSKLVMGGAIYGRTFTLADPGNNGVGAPAVGPGLAGKWTETEGFLSYGEVCIN
jgi:chitinase